METTAKLSKSSEIATAVRDAIKSGEYSGRMPTDLALATRYGVNSKTIGLALCRLESEGVVSRKRKVGTWVLQRPAVRQAPPTATKTVVLLMRTTDHLFGVLSGLMVKQVQRLGWQTMLFDSEHIPDEGFLGFMGRIAALQPTAVVVDILSPSPWDEYVKRLSEGTRLLRLGNRMGDCKNVRYLNFDHYGAAHTATTHLHRLGRRRILLIDALFDPPPQFYPKTSHHCFNMGYRKALDEAGLAGNEMFFFETCDGKDDALRLRKLFGSANRPDAILALGDFRAVRCMRILDGMGLRIPGDVALVGCYDTPWCEATTPQLASISVEPATVAKTIIEAVSAPEFPSDDIVTPTHLVPRASAPALPDNGCGGRMALNAVEAA